MLKKWFRARRPRQLELQLERHKENDRNHHKGGRSFYFFDFDDNVAFLATTCFLFHKDTDEQLEISSGEFARHSAEIGRCGPYRDYYCDFNDRDGTFRLFRDVDVSHIEWVMQRRQPFVKDVREALHLPDAQWKGPSWDCFYHATFNHRPTSVITARGHSDKTIKEGFREFVRTGDLPYLPNFLAIYAVSHPETREQLSGGRDGLSVAELKRAAIKDSVQRAFDEYGYNPHHRFGMSDDDPKNVELIRSAMEDLKREYPDNAFYVIETRDGKFHKTEVLWDRKRAGAERFEMKQTELIPSGGTTDTTKGES